MLEGPFGPMLLKQIQELVDHCRVNHGEEAAQKTHRSAMLACKYHAKQFRKVDGAPYVTHCISVAKHCLSWGLNDVTAICAALLHDVIEDASDQGPEEDILSIGEDVLELVQALSKIRNLQTGAGDMPATYRRILSAAAKDIRVLVVKTFDVLHNSETLNVHKPEKAKAKASIGLIYVGVARRLGIMMLADALIDRLLPHLMPVQYNRAKKSLRTLQNQGAESMDRLTRHAALVMGEGMATDFVLEPRKLADYFHLAEKPGTGTLQRVGWPAYRLKLLVENDEAAWRVLGKMHGLFGPLPRHVRDYLNAPRVNGYRALATRIVWDGLPVSVHVVRKRDDESNRLGILAKWGESGPDTARYMRLLGTLGDSDLRMSEVHAHVLPDLLDVYSPKGARLTFPVGSRVVDFAYLVHTEIGDHCTGAHVNGIKRPPDHPLADGDVVSVITSNNARPQRGWLEFVKTARARTLIKKALHEGNTQIHGIKRNSDGSFLVHDLTGADILWSNCCLPAPGVDIIGRLSGDGRWIVHRAQCEKTRHGGHWGGGAWSDKTLNSPPPILTVQLLMAFDSPNMAALFAYFESHDIACLQVHSKSRSARNTLVTLDLRFPNLSDVDDALEEITKLPGGRSVYAYVWAEKSNG
ncbi:putative guanosine-3',5'-bis(diphosphate) 3'-diphosphatase [Magnetofaba australis IT-1]|uniref:Putative guanosine-3',5'-bis(Diphosphate) 3'-diphosphatase n=1 Tax=Magnetofaba australis IT-1 TaxID=1434232 RepID=A0A1Y2K3Q6_9PROT|nr:putative guanosine-3',5'-bis(diphosphate) 3'-diphosphatase [Magnetofaba australis IT-1]